MSLQAIPDVFEVITFKPNKSAENAKEKLSASVQFALKHPDCTGIPIEGVMLEEPDISIRIIQWKSYDGHMVNFRNSDLFQQMVKTREDAVITNVDVKHYQFFSEIPANPAPPIIEYVTISLKPDADYEGFYKEWTKALEGVKRTPGCGPIALGRQLEDPTKAMQLQHWDSMEAHQGFREMPDHKQTMAELTLVAEKYIDGGWKGCKGVHLKTCPPGHAV